MRLKRTNYSTAWLTSIYDRNGFDHDVELNVDYTIACDGIGAYEFWGAQCFDAGRDYIAEAEATSAALVRINTVAKREDIPNIRGIRQIHPYRDRWMYTHVRRIRTDTYGIEEALERFQEEYDFENDLEYYGC